MRILKELGPVDEVVGLSLCYWELIFHISIVVGHTENNSATLSRHAPDARQLPSVPMAGQS